MNESPLTILLHTQIDFVKIMFLYIEVAMAIHLPVLSHVLQYERSIYVGVNAILDELQSAHISATFSKGSGRTTTPPTLLSWHIA